MIDFVWSGVVENTNYPKIILSCQPCWHWLVCVLRRKCRIVVKNVKTWKQIKNFLLLGKTHLHRIVLAFSVKTKRTWKIKRALSPFKLALQLATVFTQFLLLYSKKEKTTDSDVSYYFFFNIKLTEGMKKWNLEFIAPDPFKAAFVEITQLRVKEVRLGGKVGS